MNRAVSTRVWVIDLDGVIWRGTEPIAGSAEAVAVLQRQGNTVVFATNNSGHTQAALAARLAGHGIEARGEVASSAQAAATLLTEGERVLVIGEAGVIEAVDAAGAVVVEAGPADTVVVGISRAFDYAALRNAMRAIRSGARFIATNTDSTFPTADGLDPGNGALVAAVATAAGVEPIVVGKPHRVMADQIRGRYGTDGIMIGDRNDTDGEFARALGYDFGLVLTGVVTEADLPVTPEPTMTAPDLRSLVARLTGE